MPPQRFDPLNLLRQGCGEVSERFKEHAWKACVGETQPWVRIPPSPPLSLGISLSPSRSPKNLDLPGQKGQFPRACTPANSLGSITGRYLARFSPPDFTRLTFPAASKRV